jgi:hypothetical protein
MNKNLRAPLIALAAVVCFGLGFWSLAHDDMYKDIMVGLGGTQVENDAAGHECWFIKGEGTICLEVWETWMGFRDAKPVTLNGHRL